MICTSDKYQGQVYIPAVNWVLMTLTIIIVGVFRNLTNLTNAYGFAVATVMFSTTILLAVSMYYVRQWHWSISLLYLVVFGFFDALFWGAAFRKVPAGAWVPLMIGCILSISMLFWTWGKRLEDAFDGANRQNILRFIQGYHEPESQTQGLSIVSETLEDDEKEVEGRRDLMRISTCAVFHKFSRGPGVPHTFVGFVSQWPALPKVVVFMSICILPIAKVPEKERYVVRKVRSLNGIYGATYYLGFRDGFNVEHVVLSEKICDAELAANPDVDPEWLQEIRKLVKGLTHIVPHYQVVGKPVEHAGFLSPALTTVRKFLIEDIYRRLATMFPETGNWLTPANKMIHVGINAFI
jgi:KUP system potassium uptake protein